MYSTTINTRRYHIHHHHFIHHHPRHISILLRYTYRNDFKGISQNYDDWKVPEGKEHARAKLAARFGNVQIGGKGTQRRIKKVVHHTQEVNEDKKIKSTIKKFGMQQL